MPCPVRLSCRTDEAVKPRNNVAGIKVLRCQVFFRKVFDSRMPHRTFVLAGIEIFNIG